MPIIAIDLVSYEVLMTVSTGPLPNYAAFGPEGERVHVSNAGNDTISEVDSALAIPPQGFCRLLGDPAALLHSRC